MKKNYNSFWKPFPFRWFYHLDLDSINPYSLLNIIYLWGGVSCMWSYEHKKIFVYSQVMYCESSRLSNDTFHLPASSKNWQRRNDAISCQMMSLLS